VVEPTWKLPPSEDILRPRPLRRLAEPALERRFTYRRYERFLDRLVAEPRLETLTLRQLATADTSERILLGLRHDVDQRLDSALRLAEAEHRRGVRATYFVLHTAGYYGSPSGSGEHDRGLLPALRRLQELGHEVGWHNDLVTLQLVYGIDPVAYLSAELHWLRENGIDVVGTAAHGSSHCHRLGFHNNEFFLDWPEVVPGGRKSRARIRVGGSDRELRRGRLADFGLAYEAYHLDHDRYFSDARFDSRGHRWHPDRLELGELRPGERVILLVHPCHWDSSLATKYVRVVGRLARRLEEVIRERS
jgi:hypothetical protein